MTTYTAKSNSTAHACNCVGPQNGQPLCPCMMRGIIERDGHYIRPERFIAVISDPIIPETKEQKIARLKHELAELEAEQ